MFSFLVPEDTLSVCRSHVYTPNSTTIPPTLHTVLPSYSKTARMCGLFFLPASTGTLAQTLGNVLFCVHRLPPPVAKFFNALGRHHGTFHNGALPIHRVGIKVPMKMAATYRDLIQRAPRKWNGDKECAVGRTRIHQALAKFNGRAHLLFCLVGEPYHHVDGTQDSHLARKAHELNDIKIRVIKFCRRVRIKNALGRRLHRKYDLVKPARLQKFQIVTVNLRSPAFSALQKMNEVNAVHIGNFQTVTQKPFKYFFDARLLCKQTIILKI